MLCCKTHFSLTQISKSEIKEANWNFRASFSKRTHGKIRFHTNIISSVDEQFVPIDMSIVWTTELTYFVKQKVQNVNNHVYVLFDSFWRSIEKYFSYTYDENKSKNNISCRLKVDNVLGKRAAKITTEKRGYNAHRIRRDCLATDHQLSVLPDFDH